MKTAQKNTISKVMKTAWALYRDARNSKATFSECLKAAWITVKGVNVESVRIAAKNARLAFCKYQRNEDAAAHKFYTNVLFAIEHFIYSI